MQLVRRGLGLRIALALLRDGVNQDRPGLLCLAHVAQDRQKVVQVVAVDRAQIVKAQLLEQRPAGQHAAGILLRPPRRALDAAREALGHPRPQLPQRQKAARGHQPRQIGAHRPHRRRDRHVVVVQHHDQPRMPRAGVVHRLIRHAGTHRAVADHGDDVTLVALQVARHRHPSPAEIDVEECAAPNGSYSLSARRVKPDRPPPVRSVRIRSRRPVRILCG